MFERFNLRPALFRSHASEAAQRMLAALVRAGMQIEQARRRGGHKTGPGKRSVISLHHQMAKPRKGDRPGYRKPVMAGSTEYRGASE